MKHNQAPTKPKRQTTYIEFKTASPIIPVSTAVLREVSVKDGIMRGVQIINGRAVLRKIPVIDILKREG